MKKLMFVLVLGFVATVSWADDIDDLERILGTEADVKVTLGAGMLGLAQMFTEDDPEAQAVLSGLRDLTIKVYEINDQVDAEDLADWMNSTVKNLAKNGVEEIVKVADGDERVHILAKVNGTSLTDISIMVFEPGNEFVYITMDGELDVAKIKQVTGNFDININGLKALNMNL